MKNILFIIVLMFGLQAFGQGALYESWTIGDTVSLLDLSPSDVMNYEGYALREAQLHIVMQSWLMNEYLEYCKSDSVLIYSYSVIRGDTIFPVNIYDPMNPTFEGYAEWLNEILNK